MPGSRRSGPGDLDDVSGEVIGRPGVPRAVDQALAVEKAKREFLIVAGGPHRDRERFSVHADLQRLLDRDEVLHAVALDSGQALRVGQTPSRLRR